MSQLSQFLGSARPLRVVTYTSGTGTFTPLESNSWCRVTLVGGGSGGTRNSNSTSGGRGGGAGATRSDYLMIPGAVSYAVGAGGAGSTTAGFEGTVGGLTSFWTLAAGGGRAAGHLSTATNSGGLVTHLSTSEGGYGPGNISGGQGGNGGGSGISGTSGLRAGSNSIFTDSTGGTFISSWGGGGGGGSSLYGQGGNGGNASNSAAGQVGAAATGYGAGGGGGGAGATASGNGGAGSGGIIIIEEFGAVV